MKNDNIPWKSLRVGHKAGLLAASLLCSAVALAQPYVTVPVSANISIVSPGAGTPGPNQIGDGGIVCMLDPDPVGGNFIITGTVGVPTWNLLGDISRSTSNVPPAPGIYVSSGTNLIIQTYNKNVRPPAEITPPEDIRHARSKGQVRITYITPDHCYGVFIFDIYKRWGNTATSTAGPNYAPMIVGPDCWGTGLITFSVDQVSSDNALDAIGFDQYYWELTNGRPYGDPGQILSGSAFYNSADRSSITIQQDPLINPSFNTWLSGGPPYTIVTCFGRCNPWDGGADNDLIQNTAGNTCVKKPMNPAAMAPTFTAPVPTCLPWNATSFNAAYTPVYGHSYSWTSTCGWVLTAGTGTLAVTGVDQGPCTLNLTDMGPCGANVYTYTVNRNFVGIAPAHLPMPITATGTCIAPGGTFTVQLPATAQGNCAAWTISPAPSPAWPFTDANVNLHSVRTYTVPSTACSGSYDITAAGCSCPGSSAPVTINVQPNEPTALMGPNCVPYNVGTPAQGYSCVAPCTANGPLTFTWANTLGMTGASATNTINYAPVGTASGLVTVHAVGTNGCAGPAVTLNVNRTPQTPVVAYDCINVGLPGFTNFAVTAASQTPGCTYTWSFPGPFGTPAAPTGASVNINTLGNPGTYNCSVTVNNAAAPFCGPITVPFTVNVAYSTAIGVTNSGGFSSVNATPGQTSYSLWNCSTSMVQAGPQAGNSFNLTTPGAGSYSVDITTLAGCVERPPCQATTFHSPLQGGGGDVLDPARSSLDDGTGVVISPNPNNGRFTLTLLNKVDEASATLFDASGKQVGKAKRLGQGNNKLGVNDLAPGIYTVHILLDSKPLIRQVAVTKE